MAFLTLTEDEAVYILAACGRVSDNGPHFEDDFGGNLLEKIGTNLLVGELHIAEETYRAMRFSQRGDTSVNFVELYHGLQR